VRVNFVVGNMCRLDKVEKCGNEADTST
jgi:hypothetical protein